MSLYERAIRLFGDPGPKPSTIAEEKTIDFSRCLPGVSNGIIYYTDVDGLKHAYSTNYVINKCINILAYNLSKAPLRFEQNGQPLPPDAKIKGFDILQPHPRMSLSKLIYTCAVYYWYKGEFMALIDEEVPFSLEPVDPGLMHVVASAGGIITSWRHDDKGYGIIDDEHLIYANMMNPETNVGVSDFDRALPLVEVVKREIANYSSGRDFNTQFFGNYAQMGLTLKDTNGNTTLEDRKSIVKEIDNKLSKGNAWRTRCLPQGLDVADTKNLSMREMEFSQSLKDIRDIILGVFGVPRSVFGITNEVGLSQNTVAVEKRLMWTDNIQPAAYMIQEAFNQTLMKNYFPGYKVFFDYSNIDVLQDNMVDKSVLALNLQKLGRTSMEINDQLDMGWEETNDPRMNERFVESNLIPYSEVIIEPETPAKSIDSNVINKILDDIDKEEKTSSRTRNYRNKYNRLQRGVEKKMASKLGGYFAKQLGKVLALVKETKGITKTNSTLLLASVMNLLNDEKSTLADIMAPLYTDATLIGSTLALDTVKSDIEARVNPKIVADMTNKIGGINNHTYRLIRTQVRDSIAAGETTNDLVKRIQSVYKFNSSRARTIARTESGAVMNRSTDEEYKKLGVEKKQWIGGTRPSHSKIDGQIKNYNEPFDNGLMYPHDPSGPAGEVCNCKCCLAPVVD